MTVGTGATAISDSRWSERNIRYNLDGNLRHLERYQEMVTDNGFIQWNGSAASSRMQYFCSFPISVLQAKLFFFAVTKNRIGHGPRCRHSRSRRAIHRCSNDGAASIPKSGPEIRNRCSNKAFSGHSLQRFPNSPPKIKNHCTDRAKTRAIPAAIAKFTPEIKNRCRK